MHFSSILRLTALGCLLFFTQIVYVNAKPSSPSANEVVASWPTYSAMPSTGSNLQKVRFHLQQAQYPGNGSLHFSMATQAFNDLPQRSAESSEYFYLKARIAQHEHKFEQAIADLNQAIKLQHDYPSAWLLKANLHLIQQQHDDALSACKQLIGNSALALATVCSLEVSSYQQDNLAERYRLLKRQFSADYFVVNEQSKDADISAQLWFEQLAADMALRLQQYEEAQGWLFSDNLAEKPLSYIVLWADIQIAQSNFSNVIDTLQPIVAASAFKDDALLIRLAIAQKNLGAHSNTKTDWVYLSKQRIEQRIARKDNFHAADITRFYLWIEPQPALALKWAQRNYQQAKMDEDLRLLQQARAQYEQAEGAGK